MAEMGALITRWLHLTVRSARVTREATCHAITCRAVVVGLLQTTLVLRVQITIRSSAQDCDGALSWNLFSYQISYVRFLALWHWRMHLQIYQYIIT